MRKPTITRTWLTGTAVLLGGLLIGGIGTWLLLANGGQFVPAASGNGQDFVPRIDGFFWTTVAVMVVGFVGAAVGGVVQLVAWIEALISTYRLPDKAWFAVLLIGGVAGLATGLVGFATMLAYVLAGPDVATEAPPRVPMPSYRETLPTAPVG